MSTYTYSSTNKSLAEIIAEKEAKRAGEVAKAIKKKDKGEREGMKEFKAFIPYRVVDPAVTALEKPDMVRQAFDKMPGMTSLAPISTKTEGVFMPKGSSSATVVNMMTNGFTHKRVDGLAIAEQANPSLHTSPQAKMFLYSVRNYCRTHYYGNGTMEGLTIRMQKQITSNPTKPVDEEEFRAICDMLPYSGVGSLAGDGTTVMSISPSINVDASAGAPYFIPGVKTKDVIEDLAINAERYLLKLKTEGSNGLQEYFLGIKSGDPHMHEFVAMLCPKMDVYAREDYYYKVRPFGVFPGALRILFSCITTVVKPLMMNYLQVPTSISALGMTWTDGGSQKLLDHFHRLRMKSGYYPLSWGDDQLILVVAEDGSSILTNPDVFGMDMKIDKNKMEAFKMYLYQAFTDKKIPYSSRDRLKEIRKYIDPTALDNKWMSCISFFVHYMENTPLLYFKHYMVSKTRGMLSGINGTTIVDEVASACLNYHLKKVPIPPRFDPSSIKEYMRGIFAKANECGFPLKVEETKVQLFTLDFDTTAKPNVVEGDKLVRLPSDEVIGLSFLGQKISTFTFPAAVTDDGKDMTILVPKCDTVALIAGCALKTPDDKDANVRAGMLMNSIIGKGFHAITNQHAYDYLKSLYDRHVSMNHHVISDWEETEVGFDYMPMKEARMSIEYPSIFWFAKVFATEEQKKNLSKVVVNTAKHDMSASSSSSTASAYSKMAIQDDDLLSDDDRGDLSSNVTGTAVRKELDLIHDDLLDVEDIPLSSATMHVPVKAVGRAAIEEPAVRAIRLANEARYKIKFEKIRLQRLAYKNIVSRVKGVRSFTGPEDEDDFGDVDDPSLQDDIDRYINKKESYEADRLYDEWEREYLRLQRLEEERDIPDHMDPQSDEEETEEEKYYDPYSKGDFSSRSGLSGAAPESHGH